MSAGTKQSVESNRVDKKKYRDGEKMQRNQVLGTRLTRTMVNSLRLGDLLFIEFSETTRWP